MKKIRFWVIHISGAVFSFSLLLFFLTTKHTVLKLNEGDTIRSTQIFETLNIKPNQDVPITFQKFKIKKTSQTIIYTSLIRISNENFLIKVNKPLAWNDLKFYQKNWSIAFEQLSFTFGNKQYNVFETKPNQLQTLDHHIFYFYPSDTVTTNQQIIYEWILKNKKSNQILDKGHFVFHPNKMSKNEQYLWNKYKFRIIKQSYHFISFFDVYYKPLNFFISITAILFLIALLISLIRIEQ